MRIINRQNAEHYSFQKCCDGWHFSKKEALSVIAEKMPPDTAEDMHCHTKAYQLFYVLSGTAQMNFLDQSVLVQAGEGIEVLPMEYHQMKNTGSQSVEFIVVSAPPSHGDRILYMQ